jgi:hypothetical protein
MSWQANTISRYDFDPLFKHSNEVATRTRREFRHEVAAIKAALRCLDVLFHGLQAKPISLQSNVRMALVARFTNHLWSQFLLCERGLILDCFNASSTALETTALYWLICVNSTAASLYGAERSVPPVKMRERLEAEGVDVAELRDLYSFESGVGHVGNHSDNLQIRWEGGGTGHLLLGGGYLPHMQGPILQSIPASILRVVRHDPDCRVEVTDDRLVARGTGGVD